MSRTLKTWKLGLLFAALLMFANGTRGQEPQEPQQQPGEQQPTQPKPKPAARGIPGVSEPDSTVENQNPNVAWQEDNSPATGLQVPGVGSAELAHSYWIPGLEYGANVLSTPLGQSSGDWYATQYVGGDVTLVKSSSHSVFDVNYSVGGYFTSGGGAHVTGQPDHGWYQNAGLGYNFVLNRWQIQALDYSSYLPDSTFGFFGGTGIALPGTGSSLVPTMGGLTGAVTPNQSIYSAIGPRYSNVVAAQITYELSRRSSVTVSGSYGLLRFTQSGNVDNDMYSGSIGYNYRINHEDSIGILYRFSSFHYSGEPQALGSHAANFVYTKKIAKRLGMSLYGGPQITTFRVSVGGDTQQLGVSAGASLNYAMERGNVSLSYYHGLSGGGGVLTGSDSDQATFSLNRQFGRVWSGNFNFGYGRNGSLGATSGIVAEQPTFNDWFLGAGISRPFGRNVNFSAAYTARFERANQSGCVGAGCSSDFTQHMISISLQWHTRPLVL